MKKIITLLTIITLPGVLLAQWSNDGNGNNTATGNASIGGSFISSSYYGLLLQPEGDAVIKRANSGNLMLSSGGGTSDIRFNYNYGGGSGGISIFDGGTTNHSNFKINPSGNLQITSSGGFVGIGLQNPEATLHVHNDNPLPQATGSFRLLSRVSGRGHNWFMQSTWLLRDANTTTQWWTTRLHDGISIDGSYVTPGTDTRTWWERDPMDDIQSWGDGAQTHMTIKQGNVGIGTTTPSMKLEVMGDISLPSATGNKQIYTWSPNDPNWRIGMGVNTGFSKSLATSHTQYLTYSTDSGHGFAIGVNGGQSSFEVRGSDHRAFFRGNVGIGTTTPDAELAVNGQIHAEEVKVDLTVEGPDYVFEPNYNLPSLTSIESYIKENKHLPEVPSAKEMEKNGVNVGEMEMLLLKKIEELTLYVIEQNKKIEQQMKKMDDQSLRIDAQEKEIKNLKSEK
jgi:hypothetical protein